MNFKSKLSAILIFSIIFSITCIKKTEGLKKSDINPITNLILAMHVSQNDYTDTISERTLTNILETLDPAKLYFTKSDVAGFDGLKSKMGEQIKAGNFSPIYDIFSLFNKRFDEKMKLFAELMDQKWDFSVDETIDIDQERTQYTDDANEMKDRWRKRIKLQLLNLINSGKKLEEAKEKVRKRYQLVQKEVKSYDEEKMLSVYLNSFATALDPHSNYFTPDEYDDFKIQMQLKLSGIGAVLRSEDGFVYVESIIPGGPVSKLPEDKTVKVNDKIVAVAQGDSEPEDVIDIPLRDAVQKIRGKKGTTVKLTILRKDENTKKELTLIIPVVREEVVLEQQAIKQEVYSLKRGTKNLKIGYIYFPSFYMDYGAFQIGDDNAKISSVDLMKATNKLKEQNVDGIVIDLRGNPGGALNEAIKISSYYVGKGPILQLKSHENVMVSEDDDPQMIYSGPLVLLIDRASASASEIFAGAIKDYKRGLVIGPTPTFGKGSVQDMRALPGKNGAVKVTIQLFYQPSGLSNNKIGIKPDIVVPDLIQLQDFNESKMKYALDWTPLKRADFEPFGQKFISDSMVKTLDDKSSKRRKNDKAFSDLEKKMADYKKKVDMKIISLKKNANDNLDEAVSKQQEENEKRKKENKLIDTDNDIFLKESFEITADYIESLSGK